MNITSKEILQQGEVQLTQYKLAQGVEFETQVVTGRQFRKTKTQRALVTYTRTTLVRTDTLCVMTVAGHSTVMAVQPNGRMLEVRDCVGIEAPADIAVLHAAGAVHYAMPEAAGTGGDSEVEKPGSETGEPAGEVDDEA